MTRLRHLAAVALAGAALWAMQQTLPGYAVLRGPVPRHVAAGEAGTGIGFSASLTALQTAAEIGVDDWGRAAVRTTGGTWLIATLRLSPAAGPAGGVVPAWHGPSGRVYAPSRRIPAAPGLLPGGAPAPGTPPRSALAIFEVPVSEVAGGWLSVGSNVEPGFDAELRMVPPPATAYLGTFDATSGGGGA